MAPFATIYSYPGNFRVQRAQIVAALNGLDLVVDPDFKMAETNKTAEFIAKFPLGKVPAMETSDGFCIAESVAICSHLAASGPLAEQLLGPASNDAKAVQARSRIQEWLWFAESELVAPQLPVASMVLFKFFPFDEIRYSQSVAAIERAIKRVEVQLQSNGGSKFLLGDKVTLADVQVGGSLFAAAAYLFDAPMRKEVPAVVKYIETLAALPEFKAGWPEVKMCEVRLGKPE